MIIDDGMVFRQAEEKDAHVLVRLYDEAARWMRTNGIQQWKPGEKDTAHFRERMRDGEVWLARDEDGRVCGAYELWWSDEEAWGVQPPVAGYVHRLMVDRESAPAGAAGGCWSTPSGGSRGPGGNGPGWTASRTIRTCWRTTGTPGTGWSASSRTRWAGTAGCTG